ncbi:MAG: helix-turn-helix transcriptional regulator [Cryobacterium sp.]|nr:helix-turn-helix transcriptional regulator [Cryobacterium sp.]
MCDAGQSAPEGPSCVPGVPLNPSAVDQLASVFRLMGEPGRVRILSTLVNSGEVCVHDLADAAQLSESATSQALRLLRAHRVVAVHRSGRLAYYRLADDHVRQLLDLAITHVSHSPALRDVAAGVGRGERASAAS